MPKHIFRVKMPPLFLFKVNRIVNQRRLINGTDPLDVVSNSAGVDSGRRKMEDGRGLVSTTRKDTRREGTGGGGRKGEI